MTALSFHALADPGIAKFWEEMAQARALPPFVRLGWFREWEKAFGKPVEVAVTGDALAPVIRRPGHIGVPVNAETPDYGVPATSEEARRKLFSALIRENSADLLKVDRATASDIATVADAGRTHIEVMQRSPYIEVAGEWGSFEGSLRSKWVKDLKRRHRRFGDVGDVTIEMHDGGERLEALWGECLAVEASQWKGSRGTAISSRADTTAFYASIARWAAENGWLRLWQLRLNGDAIAFALDLVVGSVYYGLKVGYEPEHSRFAPGLILQHETVKYAFDQRLTRFEFLGADEPYKLNWTKTCRDRLAVHVFKPGLRGRAERVARTVVRPAVKRLTSGSGSGEPSTPDSSS